MKPSHNSRKQRCGDWILTERWSAVKLTRERCRTPVSPHKEKSPVILPPTTSRDAHMSSQREAGGHSAPYPLPDAHISSQQEPEVWLSRPRCQ